MANKPTNVDPVGLIAIANVLRFTGNDECSCELKCVCDQKCSCELKCVCDVKDGTNILDLISNPVFRQVVQNLDPARAQNIEGFLGIVNEIRAKMNSATTQGRTARGKKTRSK